MQISNFFSSYQATPKMKFQFCFFFSLCGLVQEFSSKPITEASGSDSTLVLVHVLFRHGNRTTNGYDELYPNDPYLNETYFPVGLGQLTNAGKVKEYSLAAALRKRYNDFLGPYYYPDIVESQSTDYNRTKMSLELVLAGLFPPNSQEIWNPTLNWQPIPYNYLPRTADKILLGTTCPYYLKLYDEYVQSREVQLELNTHRETFQELSTFTGLNVTKYVDIYNLYFGLATEEEWGFKLPGWTKKYWPEIITDFAIKEYYISTATTELNQMGSGYLLQKIITDTLTKINGTNPNRKIHLYSAHENNIAELLIVLGVFKPHVPNYGSHIILEVHKINEQYGIKIFYENYEGNGPVLLKLPACESFCEINNFRSLMEEYLPSDDLCFR